MSTTNGYEDDHEDNDVEVGDQSYDPDSYFVQVDDQPTNLDSRLIHERERRRDYVRQSIAIFLLGIFFLTVSLVLIAALSGDERQWSQMKDALQILLPVEASLLGSAISFYFVTRNRDN